MTEDAFSIKLRVYYEDTDAGGIVYYANYLKFCERARTEWLRGKLSQQELLEREGFGFVVVSIKGKYLSSARLDDELTVRVIPFNLKKLSVSIYQEIYNQRGERVFEFECTLAFMDMRCGKPKVITSELREFIQERIVNYPQHIGVKI